MQWIKYQIVQSIIDEETILIEKKVGYSEANLAIAQAEAYNGEYTIEEDGITINKKPIAIEFGGTGADNAENALINESEPIVLQNLTSIPQPSTSVIVALVELNIL